MKRLSTFKAFALGDTNDVDHFVLGKDLLDGQLLLEVLAGKVDLISDRSAIQLDLHDVGLLLAPPEQLLLGVANDANDLAVLLDLAKILLNFFLANIVLPLEASLGESLLLRLGPSLGSRKHKLRQQRLPISSSPEAILQD